MLSLISPHPHSVSINTVNHHSKLHSLMKASSARLECRTKKNNYHQSSSTSKKKKYIYIYIYTMFSPDHTRIYPAK